jgi:hypothetical protein
MSEIRSLCVGRCHPGFPALAITVASHCCFELSASRWFLLLNNSEPQHYATSAFAELAVPRNTPTHSSQISFGSRGEDEPEYNVMLLDRAMRSPWCIPRQAHGGPSIDNQSIGWCFIIFDSSCVLLWTISGSVARLLASGVALGMTHDMTI